MGCCFSRVWFVIRLDLIFSTLLNFGAYRNKQNLSHQICPPLPAPHQISHTLPHHTSHQAVSPVTNSPSCHLISSPRTPLLPSLPPSPSALLTPLPPSTHPPTPTPITRTPRRHLLTTPLPHELLTSDHDSFIRGGECQNVQLSPDATHFLTWFSSLTAGNGTIPSPY